MQEVFNCRPFSSSHSIPLPIFLFIPFLVYYSTLFFLFFLVFSFFLLLLFLYTYFSSSFSPPSIFLLIPLHFLTFPFFLLPFSLSVFSSILPPSPNSLVRTPPLPASFFLPFHSLPLSPSFPSFSYVHVLSTDQGSN